MKRGQSNLNFLIAVNKSAGISSHDCVAACRKIFNEGRIGHMGTLDPLATGVMLIGVGSAARLNNYLEHADKTYIVTAKFGKTTNTYDAEGQVTATVDVPKQISNKSFVLEYLQNLIGEHQQIPPAFSAIKIDGKPAYKSARDGKDVQLKSRDIEVYATRLIELGADF